MERIITMNVHATQILEFRQLPNKPYVFASFPPRPPNADMLQARGRAGKKTQDIVPSLPVPLIIVVREYVDTDACQKRDIGCTELGKL